MAPVEDFSSATDLGDSVLGLLHLPSGVSGARQSGCVRICHEHIS